jgi:anaerobic magnesium-protoporphyrin IX monomethyl ester cyclase
MIKPRPIRKVLLLFPPSTTVTTWEPFVTTPMGIAYLAAALRERDFEVAGLDTVAEAPYRRTPETESVLRVGLSYPEIVARVEREKPDLVGISCIFSNQWPAVKELTRRIKALSPDILVASGGTHPSFMAERCLRESQLDLILLGESERSFPEALERIREGRPLAEQDGIAFREGGEIRVNPKTSWIEDLDTLSFPAHDLFPPERYFHWALPMGYSMRSNRALPIVTSRGCPCRCTFCSSTHHWGKKYRARSPENVLAEMEWLISRFGVRELKFQDDNLTSDRERARKIFEGMTRFNPRLHWNTPNGIAVWTLDDDLVRLMRESGCFELTMAVESGDQEVLTKLIHKPLKLEKVVEVNRLLRRYGISAVGYFIIGFPGETRAQIDHTVRFGRGLKLDAFEMFIYNPLPGSELYDECIRRGYITADSFFEGGNQYFSSVMSSEEWTSAELEKLIRREFIYGYRVFFSSPRPILARTWAFLKYRPSFYCFTFARLWRGFLSMLRGDPAPAKASTASS